MDGSRMPATSLPSLSTAETKVVYGAGAAASGGSTQSTGGRTGLAPGATANPSTFGIATRSAVTAVPAASEGSRLGGGAVLLVIQSSSATNSARSAGVALCGLRGLTQGPGRGSTPGRPPCLVPAIIYAREFSGRGRSRRSPGSVWISDAPFCQCSVALLGSMVFG